MNELSRSARPWAGPIALPTWLNRFRAATADETAAASGLGYAPALGIVASLGLGLVGLAFTGARYDEGAAVPLYWAGLIAIFVPIAVRLLAIRASYAERGTLVAIVALALYGVKLFHSPYMFTLYDEFAHWQTVQGIVGNGRLFSANPLIPVSAVYPGLEIATSALVQLTGLPVFTSGMLLLGVARLILALSMFGVFARVSGSARIAGIAVAIYAANPNFVMFDSQFSYESLALPLGAFLLYLLTLRVDRAPAVLGLALLTIPAIVATHHITSYLLGAFLALWAFVALVRGGQDRHRPVIAAVALLGASYAWTVYVAPQTTGYLQPHLAGGLNEMSQILGGEMAGRELFRDFSGQVSPLWERVTALASVGLLVLILPFGLLASWLRLRSRPAMIALAIVAVGLPLSLAFRFTTIGREAASRSTEFLFVGIAIVAALGLVELMRGLPFRLARPALASWFAVVFVGGVITGTGPWARLPGPYLVSADSRSIEPVGVAAAEWTRRVLGPNHRVISDRTNDALLATYGGQRPVTLLNEKINVSEIVFAPIIDDNVVAMVSAARVRYLIADRRLSTGLPLSGVYFEQGEPGTFNHREPIDLASIEKFDQQSTVHRLYDNGSIVIYDIREIAPAAPGLTGGLP